MVLVDSGVEVVAELGAVALGLVGREGWLCQVENGEEARDFRTVRLVEVVVALEAAEVGIDGEVTEGSVHGMACRRRPDDIWHALLSITGEK
jgi:hypothetical protein